MSRPMSRPTPRPTPRPNPLPDAPGAPDARRIEIYDTTLRDGAQGLGVAFSLADKLNIARKLDDLGVDCIEGGYPLSNPKDEAFFQEAPRLGLKHARICAFGMTRRRGVKPEDDTGMKALVGSGAPIITIVGKTWDLHVDEVLRVDRQENLEMIGESVAWCATRCEQVYYDAEHFFDGYRANPEYTMATLRAAADGGATVLVLCDTNGGSLPGQVREIVAEVAAAFEGGPRLGIHVHNDGGLAVANTLAAVEAGADQVQGTINGIGERCGNVDLTSVIANLNLKLGLACLQPGATGRITELSRYVYETANLNLIAGQPFVGPAAFAHKGGMHVHAVQRVTHSYEHVTPESVGNTRRVLVSELSGASNIAALLGDKHDLHGDKALQRRLLDRVQDMEHAGYQFEAAQASFELLLHDLLERRPKFWSLDHYRCMILKKDRETATTEAIVKMQVEGVMEHHVAEGDGPVNALDGAVRKCMQPHYPELRELHLADFKVRVVNATAETAAKVRVMIDFATRDPANPTRFTTIGVNENIVDASFEALVDGFDYYLIERRGHAASSEAAPSTATATAPTS